MSCWPTQQWSLFRGNVFTLEFFIALSCFKTNLMGYILETIVGPLKLSFFFTSTIVYDIKKNPSRCLFVTMCLRTQESSCSNLLKIVFYFPNTKRLRHGDKVWHFEICSQQLWVLRSANLGSIQGPGTPFRRTLVFREVRRDFIQEIQEGGNPLIEKKKHE